MLAYGSLTADAAPFSNGSFETGSPNNGLLNSGDSSSIPSWVVGGTTQSIEFNLPGANGQNAQQGNNFVSFGHNGTTGASLSQTFDTVAGAMYSVSYFVSGIQSAADAQGVSVTALNALNNAIIGLTATTIPTTNNLWVAGNVLTFTATSNSTTLRFTDITASGGGSNWALDNVNVSGGPTGPAGVPDTGSTICLLALAAAALALGSRRVRA